MATHPSTLAWKILWREEPGKLRSMGSRRVGRDWATSLSCIGEGNGNHSSVLAWRIPEIAEPGGLPPMGPHRVRHDWRGSSSSSNSRTIWILHGLIIYKALSVLAHNRCCIHISKMILQQNCYKISVISQSRDYCVYNHKAGIHIVCRITMLEII